MVFMHPERLKLDMHVHSHFSKDAMTSVETIYRTFIKSGVMSIVCDHDSIEGSKRLSLLMKERHVDVPCPLAEEIATADGEIMGVFLTEGVPAGLSADETLDIIGAQGALALVPHPFDTYRSKVLRRDVLERVVSRIHIIEGYNARNVKRVHNEQAVEFARQHGKPISAGSDAHTPFELARTYVELEPFETPKELLEHLPEADVVFKRTSSAIHLISALVKTVRR